MDSVFYWKSVVDEPDAGRPGTSVIDSFVEKTEELIAEDPTLTLRFLALELGVSWGSRHMLSSTSSFVGPRGKQDGSPNS